MYSKKCPTCKKRIIFKRKNAMVWSIKYNLNCNSCAGKLRKPASKKTRKLISKALKGRKIEWSDKISKTLTGRKLPKKRVHALKIAMSGNKNPFYGKRHTEKTKKIIRLKFHDRMVEKYGISGACPMYNPDACKIIDEYGDANGYKFQHALNGGELYVDGFWVDGYDKDKNVVIEYYAPFHKRQIKEDRRRKRQIINKLHCKFIEIKSWQN